MAEQKITLKDRLNIPTIRKGNRKKGAKKGAAYGAIAGTSLGGYHAYSRARRIANRAEDYVVHNSKDKPHASMQAAIKEGNKAMKKSMPRLARIALSSGLAGAATGAAGGYLYGKKKTEELKKRYLQKVASDCAGNVYLQKIADNWNVETDE